VKHLPKHLQPRWRYLAVGLETWPDASIDSGAFQRALWYGAQNLLGDAGSADLDLSVVRFRHSTATGEAIVRVRRGESDPARAVIACLDEVEAEPVGIYVRGESGTIQACEEKYMGRGREEPDQRHVAFDGSERSGSVRNGRVDVRTESTYTGATTLDCN
jgi:ribonuclease P/MRP protein subunit POP5